MAGWLKKGRDAMMAIGRKMPHMEVVRGVPGKRECSVDPKLPGVVDARGLSTQALLHHMCSAGPLNCGKCRLCAYGREYSKREEEMRMAKPRNMDDALWEVKVTMSTGETFVMGGVFSEVLEKLNDMRDSVRDVRMKMVRK